MRPPLNGTLKVTQLFGGNPANERYTDGAGNSVIGHDGIDFSANLGDSVYPAFDGKIEIIDSRPFGFGLHAIIHRENGDSVLYGHLSEIDVSNGSQVQVHVPFAKAGSTGNSTGPHVHFLLKPNNSDGKNGYGGAIDPLPYFDHDVYTHFDLSLTNL